VADDNKTEQTNWSLRFDLSEYATRESSEWRGRGFIQHPVREDPAGELPARDAQWLAKIRQLLTGSEQIQTLQCEFCGQLETADVQLEIIGIKASAVCSNCLKN